jgi:hypothetical protein
MNPQPTNPLLFAIIGIILQLKALIPGLKGKGTSRG